MVEWVKKIYTMEYWAAKKRKKRRRDSHFMTASLKLESVMLSEISQSVKDKYHMMSLVRGMSWTK